MTVIRCNVNRCKFSIQHTKGVDQRVVFSLPHFHTAIITGRQQVLTIIMFIIILPITIVMFIIILLITIVMFVIILLITIILLTLFLKP